MKKVILAAALAVCLCSCGNMTSANDGGTDNESIISLSAENDGEGAENTASAVTTVSTTVSTTAKTTASSAATRTTAAASAVKTTATAAPATTATSAPATTAPAVVTTAAPAPPPAAEPEPAAPAPEPEPEPEPEPVYEPEPEPEPEEYAPPAEEEYTPPEPVEEPAYEEENSGLWSPDTSEYAVQVAMLANEARAANGLSKLRLSETLFDMAQVRCEEIAQSFSHTRPDGSSGFSIYDDYGIGYWFVAENIAAGQSDPQSVIDTWLSSPGHRANMLSDRIGFIGVGYVNVDGVNYWVQEFVDSDDLDGVIL
ncbi:MAG: hypothetical protein II690_06285 [Ruminococcus sp.]|nr:hypothetical protein [Ruminococcus sp.]